MCGQTGEHRVTHRNSCFTLPAENVATLCHLLLWEAGMNGSFTAQARKRKFTLVIVWLPVKLHTEQLYAERNTSFEHEIVKKNKHQQQFSSPSIHLMKQNCQTILSSHLLKCRAFLLIFYYCKLNTLKLSQFGKTGAVKEVVMGISHSQTQLLID